MPHCVPRRFKPEASKATRQPLAGLARERLSHPRWDRLSPRGISFAPSWRTIAPSLADLLFAPSLFCFSSLLRSRTLSPFVGRGVTNLANPRRERQTTLIRRASPANDLFIRHAELMTAQWRFDRWSTAFPTCACHSLIVRRTESFRQPH
jgi:hypothetical protein